ncbi:Metallo-dependent phosphatase-like protein [Gigaspora rosea]|uniref:Metallo-dependent phosphatase-like protein n=1 Tax=Gigaspora rosea TaxID=44941 RepID=A0A397VPS5_9GLOM|nr:Metallo-dependent phosphatase-like protein [Gigaspora rosea]
MNHSIFTIQNLILIFFIFQGCHASREFHLQYVFYKNLIYNEKLFGKFLHITDLHVDPYYLESSDPISFCHRYSPNPILNIAGKFGILSTPCDTPFALSNSTFEFMRSNFEDIDFIIYTGDAVRHDRDKLFKRTEDQVLDGHRRLVEYIQQYFDLSKIKFMPSLGNNDEFEHNKLPKGPNDLFSNLSQIWAPLNLNLTTHFLNGGYYRQDIHNKFSVLNLNSMYFYKKNKLLEDCNITDSAGTLQLEWLERELKNARQEKRMVYISQHVPPVDDANEELYSPACFYKYVQLIGKYSDVICGHFTGHTDKDTLAFVTADEEKDKYSIFALNETHILSTIATNNVVLTLTNAPSVKPTHNPAIRLYEYSTTYRNFGVLKDYIQYFVNLTEANEIGEAIWRVEYIASRTYGMNALGARDWAMVLKEFQSPDSETWRLYVKHITVSGP